MRFPIRLGLAFAVAVCLWPSLGGGSALAAEPHEFTNISFGPSSTTTFSDPNGIAVDEAGGDVYVADIGTDTVYKFDASGNPVNFTEGAGAGTNALTGTETPAGSFEFLNEPGNPAAIAIDNSAGSSDPSRGDLYVMDAAHDAIDKFTANGKYVNQITSPFSAGQLRGLGVDTDGELRVDIASASGSTTPATDVFDDSLANNFVKQLALSLGNAVEGGNEIVSPQAYGFATAAQPGSDYPLLSCDCVAKLGPNGEPLGQVDSGSKAVAVAVDPLNGHVYIDDQSSVSEWDTGAMNGGETGGVASGTGAFVSSFGTLQLTSTAGQGGIAVDGATGKIYVSNPADGKVYVFGTDTPALAAAVATNVTETEATFKATVNPGGSEIASCRFEYGTSPSNDLTRPPAHLDQSVPCEQTPAQIGAGAVPVPVSAHVGGLQSGHLYRFRLVVANANGGSLSTGMFPTAAPSFGIKNFEVAFINQDGTPDTQAGSHPYKTVVTIEFNTQVLRRAPDDLHYIAMPVGNVRDTTIDLPPGLLGDPNATSKKCTLEELSSGGLGDECPAESEVGTLGAEINAGFGVPALPSPGVYISPMLSMVPPRGVAFQLAAHILIPNAFIDFGLPPGRDARLQLVSSGIPVTAPIYKILATVYGVPPLGARRPLVTLPTACNGPLTSNIYADSYQEPGRVNSDGTIDHSDSRWKAAESVTRNATGAPGGMTGCAKLLFPPTVTTVPDTTDASTPSGMTVNVHVPQTAAFNLSGLAESTVRDLRVTLPEGVAINPSGADGLEACSEGLASFTGFSEFNPDVEPGDKTATFTPVLPVPLLPGVNFCPDGSKVGTVKIKTPPLLNPLEGSVYLAAQNSNPFGSLVAMYLVVEEPVSGTIVKEAGEVSLTATGQIVATFKNLPEAPFEEAELHFFGGERAPLTTPSRCGTYTTQAVFTPWDGNGPVETSSSFAIDHGPNGGACPGGSLPFHPALTGGATNIQAGSFSPLTGTFSREDGEQQIARVHFSLPPGLSGILTGVKLCPEAEANAGTCGPESQVGETTISAGVGSDPVSVRGGRVYLTEKYHGAPFGLSVVDPVKAGPFDLEHDTANPGQDPVCDCIVVRAKLEIDPVTAAVTITSNKESEGYAIPHMIDGVPVQIKKVNFETTRTGFQFNPTNCSKMAIAGSVESDEGETLPVEVPFQVTNCAVLAFKPQFSVSTSGRTSRAKGASLYVKLVYPKAPFGSQANIRSVKVDLPRQLPSRLTTLQKACVDRVFNANPASCPAASRIGTATATTPLLPVSLSGPAYFVSHGGAKFPELIIVLQGYGVTVDLHSETFISKTGVTSSTFHAIPDVPVGTFEFTLPEGPDSALAANGNLCSMTRTILVKKTVKIKHNGLTRTITRKTPKTIPARLTMPTAFTAQNGAIIKQSTPITVTGCTKTKKPNTKNTKHKK